MLIKFPGDALWEALANREGLEMREELESMKGCSSRKGMKFFGFIA